MFTRFHDDPDRIMKKLQESTDIGLYGLHTPGNGEAPPFLADPHIRLQYWGANRCADATSLESNLRGLGRPLSRTPLAHTHAVTPRSYDTYTPDVTLETRAAMPAWTLRDAVRDLGVVLPAPDYVVAPNAHHTRLAARDAFA